MASALVSMSSGPGSSPGGGIVFFFFSGKTLFPQCLSPPVGV